MFKRTRKTTLFIELAGNVLMFKDVVDVILDEKQKQLHVYVKRGEGAVKYTFPLEDVVWFEEKISNFVEIIKEGGDA